MIELDSLRVGRWEDLPPGEWLDNDADGNHWFKDSWGNYWCSDGESYYNDTKTNIRSAPGQPNQPNIQPSNFIPQNNQYTSDDDGQEDEDDLQSLRRKLKITKKLRNKFRIYRIIAPVFVIILLAIGGAVFSSPEGDSGLDCEQYNTITQKYADCNSSEKRLDDAAGEFQGMILFSIIIPVGITYLTFESKYHKKTKFLNVAIREIKNEIKLLRNRN